MTELTFDQLPKAVTQLYTKLEGIERLLMERHHAPALPQPDEFLNLQQASEFLGIAPQTIYQNIKRIPSIKRFGRHYFKRSELIAYLEEGATKKGGKKS